MLVDLGPSSGEFDRFLLSIPARARRMFGGFDTIRSVPSEHRLAAREVAQPSFQNAT